MQKNPLVGEIYSEEEQVIGTSLDGKTLYKKTIKYTQNLPTNATVTIPMNIANIGEIYKFEVVISNNNNVLSIPYTDGGNLCFCYIDKPNGGIGIRTNSAGFSSYNKTYITLHYTKTV